MVSTFAEIFAQQVGLVPTVQNLTLYQGSAWYPGMHVATSTYTKAFYAQIRLLASDAAAIVTMSSYNGGVKHWGHDFFASDFYAATVWKTFSLIVHQSDEDINSDLSDKYGQSDSQCGGLLDLFLSTQQTAALTFSQAGYDIDMIPLATSDDATADMDIAASTWALTNDGTATIGGINVGKIARVAGASTPFANVLVGDLIYFDPEGGSVSVTNTWDLVADNSRFYRVSKATSSSEIEIDRPWPTAHPGGSPVTVNAVTTTGLPTQIAPTAYKRLWMTDTKDDFTQVSIDADDDSGGTELTFSGAVPGDLTDGDFQPVVGDIVLVTGQEDIASGEADISGLQTVTGVTATTLTFSGVTSGTDRTNVDDIVISEIHETLIARIQGGQITLDDSHAHGY